MLCKRHRGSKSSTERLQDNIRSQEAVRESEGDQHPLEFQPVLSLHLSTPHLQESVHVPTEAVNHNSGRNPSGSNSPPGLPENQVTHSRLAQLQATQSRGQPTQYPAPFDTFSRSLTTSSPVPEVDTKDLDPLLVRPQDDQDTCSDSAMTTPSQAEKILWGYRILIDEGTRFPDELQKLVYEIKEPRVGAITPNSKHVAASNKQTSKMNETDALIALIDRLTYRDKLYDGDEGEHSIRRTFDCQWLDRVPRPGGGNPADVEILQAAMGDLGCPSKPKPDVTFGYAEDALQADHLRRLCAWYPAALVLEQAPWFPYFVVEWKGKGGTMREARIQARRDAAAGIDTLYKFYQAAGNGAPSVPMTCIFSLCVDSTTADYWLHWRHVDAEGKVSYQGERVSSALLHDDEMVFRLRGCILKTLDWARGQRLASIRNTLQLVQQPPPPPPQPNK
ncbi:MAG: hypothetical protein Q9173_003027 [Seirophora scorigena]